MKNVKTKLAILLLVSALAIGFLSNTGNARADDNEDPDPRYPKPDVSLTADDTDINYGSSTKIRWETDKAVFCNGWMGVKGWAGRRGISGSFSTGTLTETTTYAIICGSEPEDETDSDHNDDDDDETVRFVTVNVESQVEDPFVTIDADNTNVSFGGSTTIRWNSDNADSCTASGSGWSGSKSLDGSFFTGSLTSSKTYKITCENEAGSDEDSVTVNVESQVEDPFVTIDADNTNVSFGGSTTIRWNSDNADSCTASGSGWSGSKSLDGSFFTGSLTSSKTYKITCENEAGSDEDSVTVNVESQVEDPFVTIDADNTNVSFGGSTTIRWNSDNADSCTASGSGWSGSKSLDGSFFTGSLTSSKTYKITCENEAGSDEDSVTVNVGISNPRQPTARLSASPTTINKGGSAILIWSSTNTTSCEASWISNTSVSGTKTVFPKETTTYTIICNGAGGDVVESATINVRNSTPDDDDDDNDNNDEEPTVTTRTATDIDDESATLNGFVDSNGGGSVRAWFEWGTDDDYGDTTSRVNYGSTSGTNFSYDLDGLDSDEIYYFRAVAENENGERVYGSERTFTTDDDGDNNDDEDPNVTTYSASEVEEDSATLNGYVDTNGNSTRKWFEWGTRSGSLTRRTDKSAYSTSSRNFEDTIYNLNPNTTYYYRAVAENNDGGIDYGNTISFRTDNNGGNDYDSCDYGNCEPTAITTLASNVGQTSVRLNGLGLSDDYSSYTTGYFEWGNSPSLGFNTQSKSIGNGQSIPFYESLSNLSSGTIYYYRAVVTNENGTSRGDLTSFRTLTPTVVIDNFPNPNPPTVIYRNATVVSNNSTGTSRPSLVFLSVNPSDETTRIGEVIEYVVNYKNVSSKDLQDVVLRVSIPKELKFIETSRGLFSEENNLVIVNAGNLDPQEEGSLFITTEIASDAKVDKTFVVTANLAYTIVDNDTQEEVFAYTKGIVDGAGNVVQLGALAFLFGDGFLPNSLLGWLLLLLLLALVILAVRKAYQKNNDHLAVAGATEEKNKTR